MASKTKAPQTTDEPQVEGKLTADDKQWIRGTSRILNESLPDINEARMLPRFRGRPRFTNAGSIVKVASSRG